MIKLTSLLKEELTECGGCERGTDWTHGHDHEAKMAKGELRNMLINGAQVYKLIGSEDQLPGWISAYITLAADYIHSIAEYMTEQSIGQAMDQPMRAELPINAIYEEEKSGKIKNSND